MIFKLINTSYQPNDKKGIDIENQKTVYITSYGDVYGTLNSENCCVFPGCNCKPKNTKKNHPDRNDDKLPNPLCDVHERIFSVYKPDWSQIDKKNYRKFKSNIIGRYLEFWCRYSIIHDARGWSEIFDPSYSQKFLYTVVYPKIQELIYLQKFNEAKNQIERYKRKFDMEHFLGNKDWSPYMVVPMVSTEHNSKTMKTGDTVVNEQTYSEAFEVTSLFNNSVLSKMQVPWNQEDLLKAVS
jgi:hypothetical protein